MGKTQWIIAALLSAGLAACGGGGGGALPAAAVAAVASQPTAVAPAPSPTPIHYTALGDSITSGFGADDWQTQGYASLLAAALPAATFVNLGQAGQSAGPMATTKGVLVGEVPNMPADSNLVTLYIGFNDYWHYSFDSVAPDESNIDTAFPQGAATIVASIQGIVSAVRAKFPAARILVATQPNLANNPVGLHYAPDARMRAGLSLMAQQIKAGIVAMSGITVVDLMCDPASYDPANYPAASSYVHPDNAGHIALEQAFLAELQHPTAPVAHCLYENPV
jgi:lysophospholipase L1-like esterase